MKSLSLTRRGFLKGTASAVAFPYVITTNALGNARTPAASERVTLGHIGVGGQGTALFNAFQNVKGAQSVAVADAYTERREQRADQCKGKAYADFRELLARDDIDAVVVATPDHWHVPVAIYAARAGKDCYVEKPLGISAEQDLLCRKVFQEKSRIFQYGTQQRSQEHCHLGCCLVRSGRIGKIKSLEVIAPNGGSGGSTAEAPVPPGLDYEMWMGPAPSKPFTVDRCHPQGTYWIYDYSIGYLGGWGAHPLDILVWGCDNDIAGPWTVEGTGVVPDTGLYDTVYNWDMKFTMADGVTMTFKPGGDSTKFIGTEGWIRISRRLGGRARVTSGREAQARGRASDQEHKPLPELRRRGEVARGAASPLPDAVRSDIISHMCDIAVRLERPITWDPKKEEIVGDAEATKRLHRPMRAPWSLS